MASQACVRPVPLREAPTRSRPRRSDAIALLAGAVGALLLSPGPSAASPSFPQAVRDALDLPCTPKCTLCHTDPNGGFGTVNTPFGRSIRMMARLECCRRGEIADALDDLRERATDSDGDGTPDIAELEALTDPNREEDRDLECAVQPRASSCATARPPASLARHGEEREAGYLVLMPGLLAGIVLFAAILVVVRSAVRRKRLA